MITRIIFFSIFWKTKIWKKSAIGNIFWNNQNGFLSCNFKMFKIVKKLLFEIASNIDHFFKNKLGIKQKFFELFMILFIFHFLLFSHIQLWNSLLKYITNSTNITSDYWKDQNCWKINLRNWLWSWSVF